MLDFLKNVTLEKVEVKVPALGKTRTKVENPTQGDLRLYKNGAFYPSKRFVEKFNLEYSEKEAEDVGFGLDIFLAKDSPALANAEQNFVAACIVPKDAGKVDVFGRTTYEKNGKPAKSVLDQGTASFGKGFIEKLESIGITFPSNGYIDFTLMEDLALKSEDNIYYVPKEVARGKNKGQKTIEVREGSPIIPLVLSVEAIEDYKEGDTNKNNYILVAKDVEPAEDDELIIEDSKEVVEVKATPQESDENVVEKDEVSAPEEDDANLSLEELEDDEEAQEEVEDEDDMDEDPFEDFDFDDM